LRVSTHCSATISSSKSRDTRRTRRGERQADEARRTTLTLAGRRVIVFTFDDVFDRGDWVTVRLREALAREVA